MYQISIGGERANQSQPRSIWDLVTLASHISGAIQQMKRMREFRMLSMHTERRNTNRSLRWQRHLTLLSMLKHYIKGRKTNVKNHDHQQELTLVEEDELARWIKELTVIGYVLSFPLVWEMVEELHCFKAWRFNDEGMEHISYSPTG